MRYRKGLRSEIRKRNPLTHHERVDEQVIVFERIESWRRINPILVTFAELQRRHHRGQAAEHHIVENLHSLSPPLFTRSEKKEKSRKNEEERENFELSSLRFSWIQRICIYAHSHTLECASLCKSIYTALPEQFMSHSILIISFGLDTWRNWNRRLVSVLGYRSGPANGKRGVWAVGLEICGLWPLDSNCGPVIWRVFGYLSFFIKTIFLHY